MICKVCGEAFVLRPNKPGYANVCEGCSGLRQPAAPVVVCKQKPLRRYRPLSARGHERKLRRTLRELIRAVEVIDNQPDPQLRDLAGRLLHASSSLAKKGTT